MDPNRGEHVESWYARYSDIVVWERLQPQMTMRRRWSGCEVEVTDASVLSPDAAGSRWRNLSADVLQRRPSDSRHAGTRGGDAVVDWTTAVTSCASVMPARRGGSCIGSTATRS